MAIQPGVYRMYSETAEVLYVGKAYDLKNRLSSYFQKQDLSRKTALLMSQVKRIEVTVTHSETEALILESTLIKRHQPRYNVLLRDDKSYPYIQLDEKLPFARLSLLRSKKKMQGRYFGPYPSAQAARETLHFLQKLFGIRQCSDTFFKNRQRPCLQYQIKRCSAPCVGLIDREKYQAALQHALLFLQGKNATIIEALASDMQAASAAKEYEKAARLRDRIKLLRKTQEQQHVEGAFGNADVLGLAMEGRQVCVVVAAIRDGQLVSSEAYFPSVPIETLADEILTAFISQYYGGSEHHALAVEEVLTPVLLEEASFLADLLQAQYQIEVKIKQPQRGVKLKWLALASDNAHLALKRHRAHALRLAEQFSDLSAVLGFKGETLKRIECFDISHASGEATVASMVVFDREGACTRDYRRYHIKDIQAGDDYAALKQANLRHFTRTLAEQGSLPDLLIIDGGKGQVSAVKTILIELGLDRLPLIGIAKGQGRKPGLETLFVEDNKQGLHLPEDSIALHLLQQIRDEAHRFAITGHRKLRDRRRVRSSLEDIAGIGHKRRQALLQHFGGFQELKRASIDELSKVPGISPTMAKTIYEHLRE